MDINNLPQGYHKAVTESDFYIFDGQGVALPNEVKGRLLLIGCFDMSKEAKFGEVKYASSSNMDLIFSDASNCYSEENGKLVIDGKEAAVNDRILLAGQTNSAENGIYIVVAIGSDTESFELKRSSDANAVNAMQAGKFAIISSGDTLAGHIFQLMPYCTKKVLGEAEFNFIDLSKEGYYANQLYGFRLLHYVVCNQIDGRKNTFTFACPDFLNIDTPRMLKVLVGWDVKIDTIMQSLLKKDFGFAESTSNCLTSYL